MTLRSIEIARAIGRGAHRAMRFGRAVVTAPPIARPGYWIATGGALAWATALGGSVERLGSLRVATGLPQWAFGRGGTCVGGVYLTDSNVTDDVLAHEAVHQEQWRTYGLAFIPLYFAAGQDATKNRFEIEAGLERGGYRRAR
ncbi:hypothetical protein [Humidisolicoccus flavus]|uniref:hypothetical protein n=1 Tax=Humidisolicoccus flavus TaxID=3111414 RepID=UPI00324B8E8C